MMARNHRISSRRADIRTCGRTQGLVVLLCVLIAAGTAFAGTIPRQLRDPTGMEDSSHSLPEGVEDSMSCGELQVWRAGMRQLADGRYSGPPTSLWADEPLRAFRTAGMGIEPVEDRPGPLRRVGDYLVASNNLYPSFSVLHIKPDGQLDLVYNSSWDVVDPGVIAWRDEAILINTGYSSGATLRWMRPDPEKLGLVYSPVSYELDGLLLDARRSGDFLTLVMKHPADYSLLDPSNEAFPTLTRRISHDLVGISLPEFTEPLVDCNRVLHAPRDGGLDMFTLVQFDLRNPAQLPRKLTLIGDTIRIHLDEQSALIAWEQNAFWRDAAASDGTLSWIEGASESPNARRTWLYRVLTDEPLRLTQSGSVAGSLASDYSLDEHAGLVRLLTRDEESGLSHLHVVEPWEDRLLPQAEHAMTEFPAGAVQALDFRGDYGVLSYNASQRDFFLNSLFGEIARLQSIASQSDQGDKREILLAQIDDLFAYISASIDYFPEADRMLLMDLSQPGQPVSLGDIPLDPRGSVIFPAATNRILVVEVENREDRSSQSRVQLYAQEAGALRLLDDRESWGIGLYVYPGLNGPDLLRWFGQVELLVERTDEGLSFTKVTDSAIQTQGMADLHTEGGCLSLPEMIAGVTLNEQAGLTTLYALGESQIWALDPANPEYPLDRHFVDGSEKPIDQPQSSSDDCGCGCF